MELRAINWSVPKVSVNERHPWIRLAAVSQGHSHWCHAWIPGITQSIWRIYTVRITYMCIVGRRAAAPPVLFVFGCGARVYKCVLAHLAFSHFILAGDWWFWLGEDTLPGLAMYTRAKHTLPAKWSDALNGLGKLICICDCKIILWGVIWTTKLLRRVSKARIMKKK